MRTLYAAGRDNRTYAALDWAEIRAVRKSANIGRHVVGGAASAWRVLTPLYDFLSAWPVIGDGPKKSQWHKVSMTMAVRAGNAHDKMGDILRRHWNDTAKANSVGVSFQPTIERLIAITPQAIEKVQAQLPGNFSCVCKRSHI